MTRKLFLLLPNDSDIEFAEWMDGDLKELIKNSEFGKYVLCAATLRECNCCCKKKRLYLLREDNYEDLLNENIQKEDSFEIKRKRFIEDLKESQFEFSEKNIIELAVALRRSFEM